MKRYVEPSVEEGQRLLSIWSSITSKPLTAREIMFAMEIEAEQAQVIDMLRIELAAEKQTSITLGKEVDALRKQLEN